MKKVMTSLAFIVGLTAYAQVGINKENPEATLDVVTKAGLNKSLRVENTSSVETFTLLNNGNVGLGVDNPTEKLEIKGNLKQEFKAWNNNNQLDPSLFQMNVNDGDGNYSMNWNTAGSATPVYTAESPAYRLIYNKQNANRGLQMLTAEAGSANTPITWTSSMYWAPNGNIGIGTANPLVKLEVEGSIKSTALAGTGTRNVAVDAEGKLVVEEAVSGGATSQNIGAVYEKVRVFRGDTFAPTDFQEEDHVIAFTKVTQVTLPSAENNKTRTLCIRNATTAPFGEGAAPLVVSNVVADARTINANFTRCYTSFQDTDSQWYWIATSL